MTSHSRATDIVGQSMAAGVSPVRRAALLGVATALSGCRPSTDWATALARVPGGYSGASHERGHRLRQPINAAGAAHAVIRKTDVLVIGGGVSGLASARELRRQGVDCVVLELEDRAGGNARSHRIRGLDCPAGAHYLPVPDSRAPEIQRVLVDWGLAEFGAAGFVLTPQGQRHLCHSPQERVWFEGAWHEGLLPMDTATGAARDQIRRFAQAVAQLREVGHQGAFALPLLQSVGLAGRKRAFSRLDRQSAEIIQSLDAISFEAWLGREKFSDPLLIRHLDYCCRDDYGAGLAEVSAWAGLHYFAGRHGFGGGAEQAGVLTWPQGNGWLTDRMARELGQVVQGSRLVRQLRESRGGVEAHVELFGASHGAETWQAKRCIVATPLRVAARIVEPAPAMLARLARQTAYSSWVVVNAAISEPLIDRDGQLPGAWDNIVFGSAALGYVDAGHQGLSAAALRNDPTVLTHYRALGSSPQAAHDLLQKPWTHWRDAMLLDLLEPHPELAHRLTQVDVMRYGHAMAVPKPGVRSGLVGGPAWASLAELAASGISRRIGYAHSDLAGYSVFEEAYTAGALVARRMARA